MEDVVENATSYTSQPSRHYGCGVEATLDLIGGKWKGVILFYLTHGTCRFNQLRRLLPDVTQRMLTLQLRELEEAGVVHREVYREVPPKVEYSLTPFGRSLEPILIQMRTWGDLYRERIGDVKLETAEVVQAAEICVASAASC